MKKICRSLFFIMTNNTHKKAKVAVGARCIAAISQYTKATSNVINAVALVAQIEDKRASKTTIQTKTHRVSIPRTSFVSQPPTLGRKLRFLETTLNYFILLP